MFDHITYFEALATQLVALAHTPGQKAFFTIESTAGLALNADFLNNLQSTKQNVLISQTPTATHNEKNGGVLENISGYLYICSKAQHNNTEQKQAAHNNIVTIWRSLVSRMLHDRRAGLLPMYFRVEGNQQNNANVANGWLIYSYQYHITNSINITYNPDEWA